MLIRSEASVANEALTLVGSTTKIATLDAPGAIALAIKSVWDSTRDELTASHPWNHAQRLAVLPADSEVPPHSYERQYSLPANYLRWLPPQQDNEFYFVGEQYGDAIYSNADAPIRIRYIAQVIEPRLWSPGFAKAMSASIAKQISQPVTGLFPLEDRRANDFDRMIKAVKRQDGMATGKRQTNPNSRSRYLLARHGYDGGGRDGYGYPYQFGDI